jgi:hypothetical protein
VAKVRSVRLVIDASIAMAAGETSMHPTSRNCREFLQSVLSICHRMVLTRPIQEEWNKHQSGFARKWRASMMARKKIAILEISADRSLQKRIAGAEPDAAIAAILEKDLLLVEAALATDHRIASLDDRVRNHLKDSVPILNELASICWVNPEKPDERAVAWLEQGAPADKTRMLSFVTPRSRK